jgi:hypothetical protein
MSNEGKKEQRPEVLLRSAVRDNHPTSRLCEAMRIFQRQQERHPDQRALSRSAEKWSKQLGFKDAI